MPDFNFVPSGEHNRTKLERALCLVSTPVSSQVAIGSKKVAPHGAGHSRLESRKAGDCWASMRPHVPRPHRDPDTSPRNAGARVARSRQEVADSVGVLHPPPPDEPPHLLRLGRKSQDRPRLKRKFRKKPAGAALLARWCIAIADGRKPRQGPIGGRAGVWQVPDAGEAPYTAHGKPGRYRQAGGRPKPNKT